MNRQKYNAYMKAYTKRPEVKEKVRAYQRKYYQTSRGNAKIKTNQAKYRAKPDVRAKRLRYHKLYNATRRKAKHEAIH